MRAFLSLIGLYNYDSELFRYLNLPEGIDSETCIGNILLECGELEVIYPNPNIMKSNIGIWSKMELPKWEKLYNLENTEYDPLVNYDITIDKNVTGSISEEKVVVLDKNNTTTQENDSTMSESENATITNNLTSTQSGKDTATTSINEQDVRTDNLTETVTYDTDNTHKRAAFDSGSISTESEDLKTGTESKKNTGSETVNKTGSDQTSTLYGKTVKDTGTQNNEREDSVNKHNEYKSVSDIDSNESENKNTTDVNETDETRKGISGIYTRQQMFKEELDVREFLTMEYIVNSFKQRFCLLIY